MSHKLRRRRGKLFKTIFWLYNSDLGLGLGFLARGGSNDHLNDVSSICVIKDCIYNKGKLISTKISAQNSEIRGNFS